MKSWISIIGTLGLGPHLVAPQPNPRRLTRKVLSTIAAFTVIAWTNPALCQIERLSPKEGGTFTFTVTDKTIAADGTGSFTARYESIVRSSDGLNSTLDNEIISFSFDDEIIASTRRSDPSFVNIVSTEWFQKMFARGMVDDTKKYRYFVAVEGHHPSPSGKIESEASFDLDYGWFVDCDKAILQSFFPLGKQPRVLVPCKTWGKTGGKEGKKGDSDLVLSYEGQSELRTPAGSFSVANVRLKVTRDTSEAGTLINDDTLIYFSQELGIAVRLESTRTVAISKSKTTETFVRELVEYKE